LVADDWLLVDAQEELGDRFVREWTSVGMTGIDGVAAGERLA
jgi:hypothetical protein